MEILTISKTEAEEVRKQIPESIITITSKRKRSKGKTYFVEETDAVLTLIDELRNSDYKEEK